MISNSAYIQEDLTIIFINTINDCKLKNFTKFNIWPKLEKIAFGDLQAKT